MRKRRRDELNLNGWRVDNELTKWMAVLIEGTMYVSAAAEYKYREWKTNKSKGG